MLGVGRDLDTEDGIGHRGRAVGAHTNQVVDDLIAKVGKVADVDAA